MSLGPRQPGGWVPIVTWDPHERRRHRRRGALSCVAVQVPRGHLGRYLEGDARMRQMQVRGMSTEYPHGGDRYLGQWGAVSWIFISRVSSVSSPFVRGAPHTSKFTKKCLCRPGGWSGWGLGGQVSCQGQPPGGGIQPPHVSWPYPSIFSRKGPVGTPDKPPKIGQKRHIEAPIANVDQL